MTPAAAETAATSETAAATSATDPNRPLTAAPETVQPVVFGQLAPELQVNLQINFGFDSAALAEDEKPKMQKICEAMKQSDVQVFRIVGHTDTAGSDDYNERLSVLRANEVVRFLTEECGIDAARLEALGMGERFPFNAENTRADENRRVEFQAIS
ncbi:OmpA family protein (plasmid) [Paracoccus zhejiangensis]|uniref:OmpA family protein n=2 Tax=Paracoccus zhejiangensis TaxID=1077935 RepID=A0A2H5F561_9RHOB|nr:OmpA family protein [Paracoccus zhejiangensis]